MRHVPRRTCIGCREERDKRDLVRVVHTAEDRFLLDPTGKTAGRGAYLCPREACFGQAVKRQSFNRAFKQAVPKEAVEALSESLREYLAAAEGSPTGAGPETARAADEAGG